MEDKCHQKRNIGSDTLFKHLHLFLLHGEKRLVDFIHSAEHYQNLSDVIDRITSNIMPADFHRMGIDRIQHTQAMRHLADKGIGVGNSGSRKKRKSSPGKSFHILHGLLINLNRTPKSPLPI